MKKTILLLLMMITLSIATKAQNAIVTTDGNYTSVSMKDKEPVNTGKTFTDVDKGIIYPIYITNKGKLFITKTNMKTGKPYRSYLKLVRRRS